jgi:hypothetical protein
VSDLVSKIADDTIERVRKQIDPKMPYATRSVPIDIVAYSRGAAIAIDVAQKLSSNIDFNVRIVILIEPVDTGIGNRDKTINPLTKHAMVVYAGKKMDSDYIKGLNQMGKALKEPDADPEGNLASSKVFCDWVIGGVFSPMQITRDNKYFYSQKIAGQNHVQVGNSKEVFEYITGSMPWIANRYGPPALGGIFQKK